MSLRTVAKAGAIRVGAAYLDRLAVGAAFLGTGGGGDPYIGKLFALSAIEARGPVALTDPDDLADDELVIVCGAMGAPTVSIEKLPGGHELTDAVRRLEAELGCRARAVMSMEAGGINSCIPFVPAAQLDLPVVDADAMGRAFPELQMLTLGIDGISACPMVLVDERGNAVTYRTPDNLWAERLARRHCIDMGCVGYLAMYPLQGADVRRAAIPRTLSLCHEIGSAIADRSRSGLDALLELTRGRVLFDGKVVDVDRRTVGGFARGVARLDGLDAFTGHAAAVEFQNENLVVRSGGQVLTSVPDLICLVDRETLEPVTTETLRYGLRVTALGLPCDWRWRQAGGLALVGPRAFGYDFDYVPVEDCPRIVAVE